MKFPYSSVAHRPLDHVLVAPSIGLVCTILAACGPASNEQNIVSNTQAVVGGAKTPDELGFAIDRFQRNAALAQVYLTPSKQQGCSGTLVGDRVVLTASHCVVMNLDAWLDGSADPEVIPPKAMEFLVGQDIDNPSCTLYPQSVTIHPDAHGEPDGSISHDISVTILRASALANCPAVVPVQINREVISPDMIGKDLLQGGFGSRDYSYNFSPIRYWSLVKVTKVADGYLTYATQALGGPTFGDSGSGFLYRFPDGSLRSVGVDSLVLATIGSLIRLDQQQSYFDQVLTQDLICGSVGPSGVCRQQAAIACGPNGFTSDDCAARGETCEADTQGKAVCVCSCDATAACESGCVCDPACQDGGAAEAAADAQIEVPPGSCSTLSDVLSTTSCGPGRACDLVDVASGGIGCRPAGNIAPYSDCSPATPPCAAASICYPAMTSSASMCVPYCDPTTANPVCPTGGACAALFPLAVGNVGMCVPPENCDLVSNDGCGGGQACRQGIDRSATYCFPAGSVTPGSACEGQRCTAGHDCFEGRCRKWCRAGDCTASETCAGIGTIPGQPTLGHCLTPAEDAGPDVQSSAEGGSDAANEAWADTGLPLPETGADSTHPALDAAIDSEASRQSEAGWDSAPLSDTRLGDQGGDAAASQGRDEGCACRIGVANRTGSGVGLVAMAASSLGMVLRRRLRSTGKRDNIRPPDIVDSAMDPNSPSPAKRSPFPSPI